MLVCRGCQPCQGHRAFDLDSKSHQAWSWLCHQRPGVVQNCATRGLEWCRIVCLLAHLKTGGRKKKIRQQSGDLTAICSVF